MYTYDIFINTIVQKYIEQRNKICYNKYVQKLNEQKGRNLYGKKNYSRVRGRNKKFK